MSKAVLFGLNYEYDANARLFGCINDVKNMSRYLTTAGYNCEVYTDDIDRRGTSAVGIVNRLLMLARETYSQKLTRVWIHFSGHGTRVPDFNRDELDGADECIVPSDFRVRGVVTDDTINAIFKQFSPNTKVVCVFDCCHSGTICDLRFSWETGRLRVQENPRCQARAKVVSISACADTEYAADTWDPVRSMAAGAMTSEVLNVLQGNRSTVVNAFNLVERTRINLRNKGYAQVPRLTSSFNLVAEPNI